VQNRQQKIDTFWPPASPTKISSKLSHKHKNIHKQNIASSLLQSQRAKNNTGIGVVSLWNLGNKNFRNIPLRSLVAMADWRRWQTLMKATISSTARLDVVMTTVCQDDDDEELLDESTRLNSTLEFKLDCVSVSEIHSRPVTIGLNATVGGLVIFCGMLLLPVASSATAIAK